MVLYHKASKTKSKGTGGKKRASRDKIKAHYGGFFARAKAEREAQKEERVLKQSKGGGVKVASRKVLFANISSGKQVRKAKVLSVLESPDNRHYSRENIITRGALLDTEIGTARVTSRPGQHGIVNAVLVEARKQSAAKEVAAKAPEVHARPEAPAAKAADVHQAPKAPEVHARPEAPAAEVP